MITIFELLGMILDDISEKIKFRMAWKNDALYVECDDSDIIGNLILPLFADETIEETYSLIERSKWFFATIKLSHDQITEVALQNDMGQNVTTKIGTRILENLSELGMDDTFIKICHEITKKCGFLVDKLNIV